jgi:hypothetical protein
LPKLFEDFVTTFYHPATSEAKFPCPCFVEPRNDEGRTEPRVVAKPVKREYETFPF